MLLSIVLTVICCSLFSGEWGNRRRGILKSIKNPIKKTKIVSEKKKYKREWNLPGDNISMAGMIVHFLLCDIITFI